MFEAPTSSLIKKMCHIKILGTKKKVANFEKIRYRLPLPRGIPGILE